MPPVLDKHKCEVDGLAFLGLSLTQRHSDGHETSTTHQTTYDFSRLIDRDYRFLASTNDDGWLVAGGEAGPPKSFKLRAPDSAHCEIIRLGTYRPEWGGINPVDFVASLASGDIYIPSMDVVPTDCVANHDKPPELEIRFDMVSPSIGDEPPLKITQESICDPNIPLPHNWQLRYLHNQLFDKFHFPARFCPGAFHSTILRKAEFRSKQHEQVYFQRANAAISEWLLQGPKPLVPKKISSSIKKILPACPKKLQNNWEDPASFEDRRRKFPSGVFLFTDRNNITHHIMPNFLPPYNTAEARLLIWEHLRHEWDPDTLSWKDLPKHDRPEPVPRGVEDSHASPLMKMAKSLSSMCVGSGAIDDVASPNNANKAPDNLLKNEDEKKVDK